MPEGLSVINLGELSKPATVLIEKIADATGGIFRPFQIRRVAQAEADAEIIKASAKIEIVDLERRALHRFLHEEAKKQTNIESITQKALPAIEDKARPQEIEDDWITNFFDKCRLISDEQMQNLWSRILAGQANSPGRYSKLTVNHLDSLEKVDAELFATLCSFVWYLEDEPLAMVYNHHHQIYMAAGINAYTLEHLKTIGLIYLQLGLDTYGKHNLPANIVLTYYGTSENITLRQPKNNTFVTGQVFLSKAGQELALVCDSAPREGFKDYVRGHWGQSARSITEV